MGVFDRIMSRFNKELDEELYPRDPDYEVEMKVEIKKGEDYGEAVVPCVFYTFGHSIELNPSLVKKKSNGSKVFVKKFKLGEKVQVAPDEEVVLDNDRQEIEELESCSKCGKRIVVSEVKETVYRSCPKIGVRLSHKAPENLVIPARFGIVTDEVPYVGCQEYDLFAFTVITSAAGVAWLASIISPPLLFLAGILSLFAIFVAGTELIRSVLERRRVMAWWNSIKLIPILPEIPKISFS